MKKLVALVLAAVMLLSLTSVFAEEQKVITMWCIATESDANRPAYEAAIAAVEAASGRYESNNITIGSTLVNGKHVISGKGKLNRPGEEEKTSKEVPTILGVTGAVAVAAAIILLRRKLR